MLFAFGGIKVIVIVWQISVKNILFHVELIEVEHRGHAHRTMATECEYIQLLAMRVLIMPNAIEPDIWLHFFHGAIKGLELYDA